MSTHGKVSVCVVRAYLSVQVSHENFCASFWCFVHDCLDLLVELPLVFLDCRAGGGVALYDDDFIK